MSACPSSIPDALLGGYYKPTFSSLADLFFSSSVPVNGYRTDLGFVLTSKHVGMFTLGYVAKLEV